MHVRAAMALGESYALLGSVSWARSTARAFRRQVPSPSVVGCAPPITRRAIRSVSSSVVTASRTSSSVALGFLLGAQAQKLTILVDGECAVCSALRSHVIHRLNDPGSDRVAFVPAQRVLEAFSGEEKDDSSARGGRRVVGKNFYPSLASKKCLVARFSATLQS